MADEPNQADAYPRKVQDCTLRFVEDTVGEVRRLHHESETTDKRDPLETVDRRAHYAVRVADGRVTICDTARPKQMSALAASTKLRGSIHEVRDRSYFAWRFSNPLSGYRFLYLARGNDEGLDGYAVLQAHGPQHDTSLNLVDWEASTPEALSALLKTVGEVTGEQRVATWPVDQPANLARFAQPLLQNHPQLRAGREIQLPHPVGLL